MLPPEFPMTRQLSLGFKQQGVNVARSGFLHHQFPEEMKPEWESWGMEGGVGALLKVKASG